MTQALLPRQKLEREFALDPSLLLYLPLYELDGASFMSRDHYGHLCTVTGAIWTLQGRIFDGLNDFISCGTINITAPLTVEVWWNHDTIIGGTDYIFFQQVGFTGWFLRTAVGGPPVTLQMALLDGVGQHLFNTVKAWTLVEAGTWFHTAFTFDGIDGIWYIDGVAETPINDPFVMVTGAVALTVGRNANPMDGLIGEARIYNRVLFPHEIQRNYLASKWRYK